MKKNLKWIIVITLIIFFSFSINKYFMSNNINIKPIDKNVNFKLMFKGLKGAKDFSVTNDGDYYIAYKNKIQFIRNDGKSYDLFKNNNLDINSINIQGNSIYYSSKEKVFCYNIKTKENKCLIDNIPNFGDYPVVKIEKLKNYLYVSIGAATNSGVVGKDNLWIKDKVYNCDIPPKTLTIKGINFGKERTGAFVPYGTANVNGQMIPGHFPGNSSIIIYNLDTKESETFAWGIRNVPDMEFNSKGELIAVVGGMEDRGLRAVKGDVDYIYKIKKGMWYGWPDYSGGDPISSPRFKGKDNKDLNFILDKHPSTSPPAPLYQHKNLSSLSALAIDKKGLIDVKDSMYIYDTNEQKLYSLTNKGILKEKAIIKGSKDIFLKFSKDKLNILDGEKGILLTMNMSKAESKHNVAFMYYYIIIFCIGIIVVIIFDKLKKIINKKK